MCYHDDSGETEVLSDFTLRVDSGEFLALLGPSGCGKSTVLSLAAGLLQPDSGRVTLRGQEIRRPPLHMGYMLQRDHLFPWLTVRENALLGIRVRQKEPSARQKRHVEDLLAACGLTEFADALPGQLSGGMRQRAALVRTLAVEPDFCCWTNPSPRWTPRRASSSRTRSSSSSPGRGRDDPGDPRRERGHLHGGPGRGADAAAGAHPVRAPDRPARLAHGAAAQRAV